ncbi:MAG: ATP-binding protein [Ilumatobacter sp.]|nr:ATP-binding protein [Ilumatobacter sp.]MCB0982595.1 ATP-binding protein [Ilumatobacter sp.]
MLRNPFTPGFGLHPAVLIGREQVVDAISSAFDTQANPFRTTWLRGPSGTGKTTLLDAIQGQAGLAGWIVVQEDAAGPDLPGRIVQRLAAHQPTPRGRGGRVSARVGLPGAEVQYEYQREGQVVVERSVRDALEAVVEQPGVNGVLVTIDEVHTADHEHLAIIGNAVQHLLRGTAPRSVALIVAGLPQPTLATGDERRLATFLTRCRPVEVDQLSDAAVRSGLQATARAGGRAFAPDALSLAVTASAGYPFMLQLVGWHAWEQQLDGQPIRRESVVAALPRADHDLRRAVLMPIARPLSAMDQKYLRAMAEDQGPSNTGDIADRLGRSSQYAGVYRDRLIELGLIQSTGHGVVDFAIPGLRALYRSPVD